MGKKVWRGKGFRWLFLLLLLMTIAAGLLFTSDLARAYRRERLWAEVRAAREAGFAADAAPDRPDILPEYRALYERNPDLAGWLAVEWADLDFPVMQTKDDPEHYLRRDFDGGYDDSGTPFLDYRCSVFPRRSYNLLLYGHYSGDGRLFWRFVDYFDEKTAQKHRTFRFDTLESHGVYRVEAAFFFDADGAVLNPLGDSAGEQAYTVYNYLELDSEEGFARFLQGLEERTLYSWKPEIAPEDELLTIICCAPESLTGLEESGRFAVVAKRV